MIQLRDLPILITGASSGIGRATALECALTGMPVVLGARRGDKLQALAEEIRASGGRAAWAVCDVTKREDCAALVDLGEREFGPLYAAFANAGYGFEGPVHDADEQSLRDIFETNFWGSLNTLRPALESIRRRPPSARRGHLLMCSSCLAKLSLPYLGPYCATKAAQDHIGRAMRHELSPEGVYVSTVHPIGTATDFSSVVQDRSGRVRHSSPPKAFTQSAETVARAVVKCLRKPKGEVWTSTSSRLAMAVLMAFPGVTDWGLAKRAASLRKG